MTEPDGGRGTPATRRSVGTAVSESTLAPGDHDRGNGELGSPPPPPQWAATTTSLPAVEQQDVRTDSVAAERARTDRAQTGRAPADGAQADGAQADRAQARPNVPDAIDQYAVLTAAERARFARNAANAAADRDGAAGGSRSSGATPNRRGNDRAPRRARLQLRHLNVWSVLKFSCVLAVALFLVWLIMIAVLYGVLDQFNAFARVNETIRTINGDSTTKDVVTSRIVLYGALIIGMVNMVLFIILSTIGALVYNLCADLVGGIEVTLAERD